MYAIIHFWNNFVFPIIDKEGKMIVFETLEEADNYAEKIEPDNDQVRVISIEGVKE